jgi:branched-chain amino acid aminotransferase
MEPHRERVVDPSPAPAAGPSPGVMLPRVWVNGERQLGDGGHVSTHDRGFTLGDGVFETMRVRRGAIFRVDRHRARLSHALSVLEIPEPAALGEWIRAAARIAGQVDASLRVTVTRGAGPPGVPPPADPHPTVVVALGPMPLIPPAVYEQGLSAHVALGRRNGRAMTAGLKTTAYTDAVLAWLEARRAGADDALFLDTDAHCSEAVSSNLFMFANNQLLTPPAWCGALPGITRATVLELAIDAGIRVREQAFDLNALLAADEAFLTSSLRGLAPLVRVGGMPIGAGTPGPQTRRLMDAYAALVERECGA